MQKIVQTSRYAQIVKGKRGAVLYHSLFSRPFFVTQKVVDLLRCFYKPRSVDNYFKNFKTAPNLFSTIQELQKNYFLVKMGLDEREILAQKVKEWTNYVQSGKTLRRLDLGISEMCNFNCQHCLHFIPLSYININPRTPPSFMDWQTAKKTIDSYFSIIRELGLRKTEIYFGDAEPLFHWQLIKKILPYCKKSYPLLNINFRIDTNLSLLTEEMIKIFRKYRIKIFTSIDGYKKANDATRITKGRKGTFDQITKKCELLKNLGYPLKGFFMTITEKNFHFFDISIVKWANKMEVKTIDYDVDLINPVNLSTEQLVKKVLSIHKKATDLGIKTSGTWKIPFLNLTNIDPLKSRQPSGLCTSAKGESINVAPNGTLFICGHSSTPVGSIDNFADIFKDGSPFLRLINSRLSGQNRICKNCQIESQCAGQCQVTQEISLFQKNNKKITQMCNFYQVITRKLLLEKLNQESSPVFIKKQNNQDLYMKRFLPNKSKSSLSY